MYHMRSFAVKLNLVDQLPGYRISVYCDRILIDGLDFRLDLYGWPDNRVVFSNKMTGMNTIKRYGHAGGAQCRETYLDFLDTLGVDTEAVR